MPLRKREAKPGKECRTLWRYRILQSPYCFKNVEILAQGDWLGLPFNLASTGVSDWQIFYSSFYIFEPQSMEEVALISREFFPPPEAESGHMLELYTTHWQGEMVKQQRRTKPVNLFCLIFWRVLASGRFDIILN